MPKDPKDYAPGDFLRMTDAEFEAYMACTRSARPKRRWLLDFNPLQDRAAFFAPVEPKAPAEVREMVAKLAERLADKAATAAKRAEIWHDHGSMAFAADELAKAEAYNDAAKLVLTIARNL